MLPGFRFLFAAVMLSMSLLIFGLGATALLRAAHESFASNPSWRGGPDTVFAQRSDAPPMLATLRVQTIEKAPGERIAEPAMKAVTTTAPALAESTVPPSAMTQSDVAPSVALKSADAAATTRIGQEVAKTEIAKADDTAVTVPESAHAAEAAPRVTEAPKLEATGEVTAAEATRIDAKVGVPDAIEAGPGETKITAAAGAEAASGDSAPAAAAAEPLDRPETPEASPAAARIATLGGPPVDIAEPAPAAEAQTEKSKADQAEARKREEAKRELRRRRLAEQRARLMAQQQLQANPFGQRQYPPPQQQQVLPR